MKRSVQVTILGQSYTLRTEAEEAEVLEVAALVNDRIRQVQEAAGAASSYTAVVLTLLNVAGEFVQLQKEERTGPATDRLRSLVARLEAACEEPVNG